MMELTFYDLRGSPIAYTDNGEDIYLFSGKPVAYLSDESLYSYSGKYIGSFDEGWVLDKNGKRVFFTDIAAGGPATPARCATPARSARSATPAKFARAARPATPAKSSSWSMLSGRQFFEF
jgi:hypothetical protein